MDGDSMISLTERGLSRRTAMVGTALGSSFALSVQPVCAQTMITTPADGLTACEVKVKTKDGKDMAAYRAMPATGQASAMPLKVSRNGRMSDSAWTPYSDSEMTRPAMKAPSARDRPKVAVT